MVAAGALDLGEAPGWRDRERDEYADKDGRLPPADPRKPEDWQDGRRRLAPRFLEDLLLREPYRSRLHRKGVRIRGAWFDREIDLEWAEVIRQIWLSCCRFERPILLTGLHTPHSVSFEGSACAADLQLPLARIGAPLGLMSAKVVGTLMMDSVQIGQSLLMRSDRRVAKHQAEFNDVMLTGAKIGGQVSLVGAKVTGTLNMDSVDIGSILLMRSDRSMAEHQADFRDVVLRGAKVGGNFDLIGAKIAGTLDMDSVDIGQSLFMRSDRRAAEHRAEFKDVVLRGAKVGGQVSLSGAKVAGTLNMNAAKIGESVFMLRDRRMSEQWAEFDGDVRLTFAAIARNLDVRGAALSSLDLTGTRIRGELRLTSCSWSPRRQNSGKLVLHNASVDSIRDTDEKNVWPPALDLDGFTYRRLGGLGADAEAGVARRGSRWFIDWLAKDEPYTPQPYQQCAQVLREMGHPEMANSVLYAGRERERKQAWRSGNRLRATGLLLLKAFVGYGYGHRLLWHPVVWVVALVAVKTAVLHLPPGLPSDLAGFEAAAVAYSFDTLLPIVELEKSFAEIVLHGFSKYYFYFQKLMGWVLASFLIAGLSGLTK